MATTPSWIEFFALNKRKPAPGEWEYDTHPYFGPDTASAPIYDLPSLPPLYNEQWGLSDWIPMEPLPTEPTEPTESTEPAPTPVDSAIDLSLSASPTEPMGDTVYPKGSSVVASMGLLREGPYVYHNPEGETHRGVTTNISGLHQGNPFYNIDRSLERTQYTPRWFTSTGLLPSSYEDYIVPLSDVTGFTEEDLRKYDLPNISALGDFASQHGGVLDQVGVIPNWYGLDIPNLNYSEDRYYRTPEDAYIPNDFIHEYQEPGFVEGAYLGPDPGLFGLDESGEPYSGWIPGQTIRGSVGLPGIGNDKIVWGPEGNAYYMGGQADWDKYFPEGMPSNIDPGEPSPPPLSGLPIIPISDSTTTPLPDVPPPFSEDYLSPEHDYSEYPPLDSYDYSGLESYFDSLPPGVHTYEDVLSNYIGRPVSPEESSMLFPEHSKLGEIRNLFDLKSAEDYYSPMPMIDPGEPSFEPPPNNDGLMGIVGGGIIDPGPVYTNNY